MLNKKLKKKLPCQFLTLWNSYSWKTVTREINRYTDSWQLFQNTAHFSGILFKSGLSLLNHNYYSSILLFINVKLVCLSIWPNSYEVALRNSAKKTSQLTFTCSKLTIKTSERRLSSVFIITFEHISHLFLVSLLLTLNK